MKHILYIPNIGIMLYINCDFEEVEEEYWFGPVCECVDACVLYTCTRSRTVRDRNLKLGMWEEDEKLEDLYFLFT